MTLALALLLLQTAPRPPTYNRDVAPILWQNCGACHRPGEVGPFSLLTYTDVKKRAEQIVERVDAGAMPPWIPDAQSLPFAGERRVGETDKQTLRDWLAAGAPEGAASDLPAPPKFPEGWHLGTPDLVVEMPEAFVVAADGPDLFRNFVVPTGLKQVRWIRALEIRPDNARVVHHAEVLVDTTGSTRRLDLRESGVGFDGRAAGQADNPDGFLLGWTPGKLAREQLEGTAWRLAPQSDLLLRMHLVRTGKPESVRIKLGLWFAPGPPARRPVMVRLGSTIIDLPANEANYAIEDQFVLPVGATLLSVYPHAHYLARNMSADVVYADGRRVAVLRIDDWDFNWQDEYRLKMPLALPAGARLSMRYVYDNSPANPRNPARPPRHVLYGPNSSDEMGDLWLGFLCKDAADTERLAQEFGTKDFEARLAGFEAGVRISPNSADAHANLGSMLLASGVLDRAESEYRRAVQLDATSADAIFNLGVIALRRKDTAAAIGAFDAALACSAFYPDAWHNRGIAQMIQKDFAGATVSFQRALDQFPAYADVHNNLGIARANSADFPGARASFERALEIDPEHVEATFMLGNVWLEFGDKLRAVQSYRRTLELSPAHAGAKKMLERVETGAK